MAVTKRLRYEILRRDNHTCHYCGGTAPDVKLTVDHVTPSALGGSDEPTNLVAACVDCNAGKTSSSPDAPLLETVSSDALRWAAAIKQAAEIQQGTVRELNAYCDEFDAKWLLWRCGEHDVPRPADWRRSVEAWKRAGASVDELLDALDRAMSNSNVKPDGTWKYTCGIVWARLKERQELARKIVDGPDEATNEDGDLDTEQAVYDAQLLRRWKRMALFHPPLLDFEKEVARLCHDVVMGEYELDAYDTWTGGPAFEARYGFAVRELADELIQRPNVVWTDDGKRTLREYAARLTQTYFEAVVG